MSNEKIKHEGFISGITPETIFVNIISKSACNSCDTKGFCSVSGNEEKIVEVNNTLKNELKTGDHVTVSMHRKMGVQAVLWAYFFPFFFMLATLIIVFGLTKNEGISGLAALLVLVPYYFGLYLFRNKMKSSFEFKIEST